MASCSLTPGVGSASSSFLHGQSNSLDFLGQRQLHPERSRQKHRPSKDVSTSVRQLLPARSASKHTTVSVAGAFSSSPLSPAEGLPSLRLHRRARRIELSRGGLKGRRKLPSPVQVVPYDEWLAQIQDQVLVHGPVRDVLMASVGAMVAISASSFISWLSQRNEKKVLDAAEERGPAALPELPPSNTTSMVGGVEMGVGGQKESAEWVNMVLHKIWKVYRRSLEAWLVGLLQPAIDTLPLPSVVSRVRIAEFSLDFEPLSVRNVQRRASRRANDLQYHVGLRYTGDARCLLHLHLRVAGVEFVVPVGVQNLDVDAEMWVKLRLTPRKPYVGTLSIAFVRLPTIKLMLAPFRIVNLFAVPFLSSFLSKLLTVDLPRLLVLPRHITFDFLPAGEDVAEHMASAMVLDLLKSETFTGLAGERPPTSPFASSSSSASASTDGSECDASEAAGSIAGRFSLTSLATAAAMGAVKAAINTPGLVPTRMEPSDAFVGELSVTLCEARNLPSFGLSVFSNPYCRLAVGEVTVDSKRNSETSHPAGARDPVWNQDFHFWVEDPVQQKLSVVVRDSMAFNRDIGYVQVPIWQLQDCVPLSMWLPLLQDGPFGERPGLGEVRLLLTYKSYVDQEEDDENGSSSGQMVAPIAYIKVFGESESESDSTDKEEETDAEEQNEREREREREREEALSDPERAAGVKAAEAAAAAVVGGLKGNTPSAVAAASVAAAAATAATLAVRQAVAVEAILATHSHDEQIALSPEDQSAGYPAPPPENKGSFVGIAMSRVAKAGVGTMMAFGGLAGGAAGFVAGAAAGAYDVAKGLAWRLLPFGSDASDDSDEVHVVSADRTFLEPDAAASLLEEGRWAEGEGGPMLAASEEEVQIRIRACPVSDWSPPPDFNPSQETDSEGEEEDELLTVTGGYTPLMEEGPNVGVDHLASVNPDVEEALERFNQGGMTGGYTSDGSLYEQQRLARMVEWELGSRWREEDIMGLNVQEKSVRGSNGRYINGYNGHKVHTGMDLDVTKGIEEGKGGRKNGMDDWEGAPKARE